MAAVHQSADMFPVHRVPMTRPFVWVRDAWADLLYHRGASLAYGWLVATLGALILAESRHPFYLGSAVVGFLLIGPVFTAGLCELSRRQSVGEKADFQSSLEPLRQHRASLFAFAGILALIAIAWFAVSGAVLNLADGAAPSIDSTVWGDVLRQLSDTQLFAYCAIGLLLACLVLALSVVSVPMIVDRHVDAGSAIRMSLRVSARDFPAIAVWALLVAGLVLVGFATALLGMVIVYPLLGHATWRAYRELVDH